MAVGGTSWPDALDPGDLASLIKLMVPPLLGNADNFLPGISLPPLDLGSLSDSMSGIGLRPGFSGKKTGALSAPRPLRRARRVPWESRR